MAELQIADDLALPLDLVVQQSAILARTGAGKTNAATVICEELLSAGQQVVIIDPPGAWWGLTASADGGAGGYAVVVLGGEHGNLALPPSGGSLIADIVVDTGLSVILDLSDLSNAQVSTFVLAFAARLYERKARARSPLLLVIEEADEVAPQRAMPDQTRMLGAIERVVKRGRMRGIGTLMISQRSASLNKNVLSQAELLIAMQTTAPQDIKAIDAWIEHHGDQERRQQLISEIATLGKGEAFVWSPGWLHEFRRIRFRLRRTFDSSATPKPGEILTEPTARASVDLDAIRALLETAQPPLTDTPTRDQSRALAEQRRLLEEQDARIVALEAELRDLRARLITPSEALIQKAAEVYVRTRRVLDRRADDGAELLAATEAAKELQALLDDVPVPVQPAEIVEPLTRPSSTTDTRDQRIPEKPLAPVDQRILDALVTLEALGEPAPPRAMVAAISGYRQSGSWGVGVGRLQRNGHVVFPGAGLLALTDAGRQVAHPRDITSLAEVHDLWRGLLDGAQRKIFDAVLAAHPSPVTRATLAAQTGYRQSGSFGVAIAALKTMGAVVYPKPDHVAVSALLFPEALR